MPELAGHTPFQAGRIWPVHQHIQIVIAFEYQRIAPGQGILDVRRDGAGIGQYAEARVAV